MSTPVKRVTDSIVDEQLDIAELAGSAYDKGKTAGARVEMLARDIMRLRASGKLTAERAKELLREGMLVLVLASYADLVGEMQSMTDAAMAKQNEALAALDGPITSVPFVRDADIASRTQERAQEKLNGGK